LEIELNNSNRKWERALLHLASSTWVDRPIRPFGPWQPKQGKISILTSDWLAGQFRLASGERLGKVVPGSTLMCRGTGSEAFEEEAVTEGFERQ
jgi:hypothetical protein